MLKGKTVIIGVTGSIAAYKAADLASRLVKLHAEVHVIMTDNATNFIHPITFETLTSQKCLTDTFDRNFQYEVEHVELAKKAAAALGDDFDIEIIEKHHNQKLDAPSGTALLLADKINEVCEEKKEYIYGREGGNLAFDRKQMGIHALRGGTVAGEHKVIFAGPDEIIEVRHLALSREIFAHGALAAAEFMAGKGPGLYSMDDLIG